jgi:hypothetical protein
MDQCHLRDDHPGMHDFDGMSHLDLPKPVPDFKQRVTKLLEDAHVLILSGRALHGVGQENWFDAQQRWLTNLEIHLGSTEE